MVERLAERVAPDGEGHEREGEGGEEDVLDVCAVGGAEDEGAEGGVSEWLFLSVPQTGKGGLWGDKIECREWEREKLLAKLTQAH